MSGPLSLMVQSKFYEVAVTYREGASGPLTEVLFTVITDSFAPCFSCNTLHAIYSMAT